MVIDQCLLSLGKAVELDAADPEILAIRGKVCV
jgi:hypothetical protein